jgi:hypothetical protein
MLGEEDFGVQDVDFDRATARKLNSLSYADDPHLSARWSRIKEEIEFVDVVRMIHDGTAPADGFISCPFHGRDRKPSFHLYRGSNDAWCYGCAYGQQLYDHVTFVVAKYGYTKLQAVAWLEKHFDLPPMEFEEEEEEDDESEVVVVNLNHSHLSEPYIEKAAAAFQQALDPELAREYIAIYFAATPARDADLNSEEELAKSVPLARVLGWKTVEEIKKRRLL